MKNRLKIIIASLALLFCLVPAVPVAAGPSDGFDPFGNACNDPKAKDSPACQADGSDPITGKSGILYKVNRILALVAAIAAVIMIIIGGFMYVTAAGDAGKAKTARTIIISAVVGLVVIAIAELFIALIINLVN